MSISAMEQALKAMELALNSHNVVLNTDPMQDAWQARGVTFNLYLAMDALREAIMEAEKQDGWILREVYFEDGEPISHREPQWVGLTKMELIKLGVFPFGMSYELYEAIEAKLKEKNT